MDAEDDLFEAGVRAQEGAHRAHGDARRLLPGEAEHTRGNTAEGDAPEPVFHSQRHTGAVTGGKLFPIAVGELAGDDRADGVQDMARRQVIAARELGLAGRLLVPLRAYDRGALLAQLEAGGGMDHVSDPYQNHT